MPPPVAALVCILFISFLFLRDREPSKSVSAAVWIPTAWMFIAGSRFVSHWLSLGAPGGTDAQLDGSPADRAVFSLLIAAGLIVLVRRRVAWGELFRRNLWIWAFFLFGALSLMWSELPALSFKRLVKALGNVVMALVIVTDQNPRLAFGVVVRRLAYLALPLSLLFIKYYPDLGRAYHMGRPLFTGVAMQKNGLSQLCLIAGTYFVWVIMHRRDQMVWLTRRIPAEYVLLALALWLMYLANSATAWACLIAASLVFAVARLPAVTVAPRRFVRLAIGGVLLFGALQVAFDAKASVIGALGRDETLTTRVPMWEDLLAGAGNPLLGYGYEVFWATRTGRAVTDKWAGIFQAHNGYLEMYLNLGYVGVLLLGAGILAALVKAIRRLTTDYSYGVLQFAFISVVILYNYTEASFRSVSNIWLLLFVFSIDCRTRAAVSSAVRVFATAAASRAPRYSPKGR